MPAFIRFVPVYCRWPKATPTEGCKWDTPRQTTESPSHLFRKCQPSRPKSRRFAAVGLETRLRAQPLTRGPLERKRTSQHPKAPFALQKDTFKNRRTAALLRLIKQGGRTPAPCFFIPPSGPPLTAQKILWPAGHQSDGNSQNCHGACHLIPRLAPSYRQSPSRQPWRATQPPTHSTRHFVNNNKKTACVYGRNSVKYVYETAEA